MTTLATKCPGKWLLHATLGLATLALAACGGGGQLASGGIVGTGISISSVGAISAIGSVTVNGVRFTTLTATVRVNGLPASEADLKLGLVVTVQGQLQPDGSAIATSVDARTEVKGVVSGVDGAARAFTVLGQRVRTDHLTVFAGGTFDTLLNQYVEVSGFRGAAGDLLATRVEIRPTIFPGAPLEVTGAVSAFNSLAKTFAIGAQEVDYSQVGAAFLPPGLMNGVVAEVHTTMTNASGAVVASEIRLVSTSVPGTENSKVEIEGVITDFVNLGSFRVNGQSVDGRVATLTGGTTAALANGAKVEIEGQLTQGIVVAAKIEIEHAAEIVLDAKVEVVEAAAIVLGGQRFSVPANAQFEDRSALALRDFSLPSIRVGDRLLVYATRNAAGIVATRIVRLDASAPEDTAPATKVEGTVTDFVSVASFKVGGIKVNAGSARFEDGVAADLRDGRRVEVEGVQAGDIVLAIVVEFEDGDAIPPSSSTVQGAITEYVSQARFKVAGQQVDAMQALFEGGVASDLANGRQVSVAGAMTGGVLVASKLVFTSPPSAPKLEVEGSITDFLSVANFKVAGQSVDASAATIANGTSANLVYGRKVGVVGTLVGGVLRATKIEIKDAPEQTEVSVKGVITSFVSISDFTVASRRIDASTATFEHGSAANLANGRHVEVEGRLDGEILVAKKVSFD